MSTDQASLLQRLQTRTDHEAWERFAELYAPLLYFWACRLHLQAEDAADLVQEVFLALLQKMPEFRLEQHRSFRAWLRTLTHNKWCDLCRRRGAALRGADDSGLAGVSVPDAVADLCEAEYRRQRMDLLMMLQWWLRDIWLQTMAKGQTELLNFPLVPGVKQVAQRISAADAMENLRVMEQLQRWLGTNVQEALALEVGLLKLHL